MSLENLHTRQLLSLLAQTRIGYYDNDCDKYWNPSSEEIKQELAKREHVPNKKESKGLRLQKIRASRRSNKLDKRFKEADTEKMRKASSKLARKKYEEYLERSKNWFYLWNRFPRRLAKKL